MHLGSNARREGTSKYMLQPRLYSKFMPSQMLPAQRVHGGYSLLEFALDIQA